MITNTINSSLHHINHEVYNTHKVNRVVEVHPVKIHEERTTTTIIDREVINYVYDIQPFNMYKRTADMGQTINIRA